MELSSYARCFPELGMDDCNNFNHLMQNDDYHHTYAATNTHSQHLSSFSSEIIQTGIPAANRHPRGVNMGGSAQPAGSHQFEWVLKPKDEEIVYNDELMLSFPSSFNWKSGGTSSSISNKRKQYLFPSAPLTAKDHILAERKRRENISQRLIALSAIIPGLKKMDKASVLESATKYVKQLEERIRSLEEEVKKKKSLESVVLVRKSQISGSEEGSCCDDDQNCLELSAGTTDHQGLPEIEIRKSDKIILIKIFCEKYKNFLPKLLAEVEKLHLTVLNSIALPFGSYAMDITISAQMDAEFCLSRKDLIRNLHSTFNGFI
ncbi:transcription factor bHLH19 [Daucus carota subsp. sativus]|uniref:transcription factor bHLH19 n=1 Tax=Daucus carota subsp. sativus TaxID=79200 RepID=UPI0007B21CE3|nr:PREDICTED: transcription factor bHLH19-like [Daucus carota subsp. sativus]